MPRSYRCGAGGPSSGRVMEEGRLRHGGGGPTYGGWEDEGKVGGGVHRGDVYVKKNRDGRCQAHSTHRPHGIQWSRFAPLSFRNPINTNVTRQSQVVLYNLYPAFSLSFSLSLSLVSIRRAPFLLSLLRGAAPMVGPAKLPATKPSAAAAPSSGEFELRHWHLPSSLGRRTAAASHLTVHLPSTPSSATNGDLHRFPADSPGYTSLRDLLGSPVSATSPSSPSTPSGSAAEIRIRNRLVKQAAYAYLQPTPSGTDPSSGRRRGFAATLWRAWASCFGFLRRLLRGLRR